MTNKVHVPIKMILPQKRMTLSFTFNTLYNGDDRSFNYNNQFDSMVDQHHPYSKIVTQYANALEKT